MNPIANSNTSLHVLTALCVCVSFLKVNHTIQVLVGLMNDRMKKYHKYVEQFQRVTEMVTTLNKVKATMDDIIPCMDRLNQMLPASEQLEPFALRHGGSSIQ